MANMLGSIQVIPQTSNALIPPISNCVEVGEVLVIGGIRPQNFDVVYRPDGVRFAFDAKTLNDKKSIRKNWQNMVNDLATEATSVHGRFPYAVVAFLVALPSPALLQRQQEAIVETLERLARRVEVNDPVYMAEVISLVVWHPATGLIDPNVPDPASPLRIESFSPLVEAVYLSRYKGLPPHTA